jgi:tetratricopeptide (TPR) repeat protein
MNLTTQACTAFEQDISLFVDHELASAGVSRLTSHLTDCEACRSYVDDLRDMADLHREMADDAPLATEDAVRGLVDRHSLFAGITRRLLLDKSGELARLFYELGKAYVLAGNQASLGRRFQKVAPVARVADIRATTDRARRVAREGEALAAAAPAESRGDFRHGSLFGRSRKLFDDTAAPGAGALASGLRCLTAALALRPELDEARLYLGFHHMLVGRLDRAGAEFRRVYRSGKDPVHRLMALQYLGNVHSTRYEHKRAIECYEQVAAEDRRSSEPRFYTALVNLGMDCAKLGLEERSARHFAELVERFPAHLNQSRQLLSQATDFTALLQRDAHLRESLRRSVPALFAA